MSAFSSLYCRVTPQDGLDIDASSERSRLGIQRGERGGVGVVLTFAREMAISPSKADVIGLARADRCW